MLSKCWLNLYQVGVFSFFFAIDHRLLFKIALVIYFTYHEVHYFNSVGFNVFRIVQLLPLSNLRAFSLPSPKLCTLSHHSPPPTPQSLATTNSLSVSDLRFLSTTLNSFVDLCVGTQSEISHLGYAFQKAFLGLSWFKLIQSHLFYHLKEQMASAFSRPRLSLCIAKHADEHWNSAQNHNKSKCEMPRHRQSDSGISWCSSTM